MSGSSRLIKSKDRVKDVGEVFTPDFLVEQMLDQFPKDAWIKTKNWLEPTCGNGQFILGILHRKLGKHRYNIINALNTTFGCDIMTDNVSECHVRIYKEIVLPYAKKHKLTWEAWEELRYEIVCIVETNIKPTKDALTEDFTKWRHFEDRPQKQQSFMISKVKSIFRFIDEGTIPCTKNKTDLRLFKELSTLQVDYQSDFG